MSNHILPAWTLSSLALLSLSLIVSFYLPSNLPYGVVCRYLGPLLCPPPLSRDVPTRAYCTGSEGGNDVPN